MDLTQNNRGIGLLNRLNASIEAVEAAQAAAALGDGKGWPVEKLLFLQDLGDEAFTITADSYDEVFVEKPLPANVHGAASYQQGSTPQTTTAVIIQNFTTVFSQELLDLTKFSGIGKLCMLFGVYGSDATAVATLENIEATFSEMEEDGTFVQTLASKTLNGVDFAVTGTVEEKESVVMLLDFANKKMTSTDNYIKFVLNVYGKSSAGDTAYIRMYHTNSSNDTYVELPVK